VIQGNPCGVKAEGAKRLDICHVFGTGDCTSGPEPRCLGPDKTASRVKADAELEQTFSQAGNPN
jgi:hypothetical protein